MTAALIVEVADSSLSLDRTVKAGMYARALIAEYWIVNLHDRQLEIHRQPSLTRNGHRNYTYHLTTAHEEHETVSTLLAPNAVIAVSDLFPRKRS